MPTDIAAAIAEAQDLRAARTEITQDWVLTELRDTCYESRSHHQQGPALRALELIGKHLGMFSDRVDVHLVRAPSVELATELGLDPEELYSEAMKLLAPPK